MNLVLCLLSTRQYLTAERIRAIVPGYADAPTDEAFFRTFERDKAELRDLGIPLETGRNSVFDVADGYRIARRDYELGDIDLEPDEAAAVALAVLGVGMVLGAFLRGGRGLIAFALPVGALALLSGTVHDLDERLERYDADRDAALERQGPQHVVATSPAQLDARYRGGNHPVSLDLRGLHLDEEQTTSVRTDSGPIQVLLPAGLPADVRCSSEHGPVRCLGAEVTGGEVTVTDHAADGAARGRANDRRPDDRGEFGDEPAALRLELSSSNGPVEVRRG